MRGAFGIDPGWGITPVRIVMGLIFVVAGYTKLAVTGLPAVTAAFAKYAIPLPGLAALLIAVLELVGGLLVSLAFQVAEHHRRPILLRQPAQLLVQNRLQVRVRLLGRYRWRHGRLPFALTLSPHA